VATTAALRDEPAAQAAAPGDFPDIGDYALIGDCRTAALVSRFGGVEWMCVPNFSAESIFAAVLDRDAGHFSVRPVQPFEASRSYVDDTNVLETTFRTASGEMRLTDCMTLSPGETGSELYPQHELLRKIEGIKGEVEIEISFAPRPSYGRKRLGFVSRGKLGWQCTRCPYAAFLLADVPLEHDADQARLVGRVKVRKAEVHWLSFVYDHYEACILLPLGDAAQRRLDRTNAWWRGWCARCHYDGPYRGLVVRSILALKLMTSSNSGAVLAAPTTSLPEELGGSRNWDYRFCWIRDSALVLHAFLSLGFVEEAHAFLEWLLHATRLTWQRFQVMYDLYGETKLDEKQLEHLSGYRGARPVRIGNAAHDQLQLDIYGELMETIYQYVQAGGTLDATECNMLAGVGRHVIKLWREPDQGIWETRSRPRHHTLSKAMCWVTLDRLRLMAEKLPIRIDRDRLARECDLIRGEIESKGFDENVNSYVAYYDGDEPDASLLLLARYGYAKPGEPRMQGTFEYIRKTLVQDKLIKRYRPERSYDGIHGGENAFAPCSFWAVEYLANAGEHERAKHGFERLCTYANDVGLFGEEIEWTTHKPMGNFPQAFTHVSLISAATALYQRKTA
jgi:GH15 family glucan-1,4-alpha-glucosidase